MCVCDSQLKDTEDLKAFGECIITIQACVIKKFLQGFMAPKQKKKKRQAGEESGGSKAEELDDEKRLAEEARVSRRRPAGPRRVSGPPLTGFSPGGHGGGEVEDGPPRGADLLPHARPAGHAGRLHQVGHVGRERSLQSLQEERYAGPERRHSGV